MVIEKSTHSSGSGLRQWYAACAYESEACLPALIRTEAGGEQAAQIPAACDEGPSGCMLYDVHCRQSCKPWDMRQVITPTVRRSGQ